MLIILFYNEKQHILEVGLAVSSIIFPESARVLYKKNPILTAICQLRFPPVLRIDASLPSEFQDRMQSQFPYYEQKMVGIPETMASKLPGELAQTLFNTVTAHEFVSKDKIWAITLTRNSVALTTRDYIQWEDFRERLDPVLKAVQELYSPPFFTRIGLRYQNVIRRSVLKLQKVEWSELLNPKIVGLLGEPQLSDKIKETFHQIVITLDREENKVRLQHGIVVDEADKKNELCYLLDIDQFIEQQIEVPHVHAIIDKYNTQNGRFFRWAISERLHSAMGPKPI